MADERKVLINIHSSENRAPSGSVLNYGEIAVSHHSKQDAALYTKISDDVVAKFISEDAIDGKISAYTDDLIGIVQSLADLTITDIQATTPISASTKALVAESCGNTVTIMHVLGSEQSGFKKLSSDVYGHITGGTAVEIGDVSGLTGFQKAVRDVETKLTSASTGNGNIVKNISVNDHEITFEKGNITSGDVTDFADAVKANETKLTSGTTGSGNAVTDIQVNDHEIIFVKGEKFALSGHTHDASEIVSGVLDIERIPTAPVSSSASGTVATGEQIQAAIDNALTSTMNYKGATNTLPSSGVRKGDVYIASNEIVIPAGSSTTGAAATAETGDYIIARTGGASATWDVIEKNLDGAVTSTGLTDEEIVIADGNGTAIKSVSASSVKVGSADTATNLDEAPSLSVDGTQNIKVTAGNKTSDAFTVPFATSATTSESATSIDLSGVQNADDLKAIEALVGREGVLKKTDANTWELVDVIDTVSVFSGLTVSGSLVDAKVVKDVIVQNERITSAALNDLNDRINELSGTTPSIETTLAVYDDSAITVTVGEETSNALVVPYATSAATIINTVKTESEFSALTENGSYVDAKLIRDIIYDNEEVTSAALNDLNARVEELSGNSRTVIDTIEAFSGVSSTGSLVDAKIVKDVIVQNERITSAALNDLNDRINELSGGSASDITELSGSVITLSASTVGIESGLNELSGAVESLTFTQYASAITINGTSHVVVNNGVDLGNYLSASTAHITTIQQTSTASAVTTTINYITENGSASAATIVQDLVIDCGTY